MGDASGGGSDRQRTPAPPPRRASEGEIRDWLVACVAGLLRCRADEIDVDSTFDRLGLDSAMAVGVTLDLEYWLGRPVEPAVFFDYPSVRLLAAHLSDPGPAGTPAPGGGGA